MSVNKKKGKLGKIILKALIAFFAVILLGIIFIIGEYYIELNNNKNTNKRTIPLLNAYVIISPSMVPTIDVQDAVVVRRVNANNLKKGDIITFSPSSNSKYEGLTITHRIIGIKKEGKKLFFKTKGDNNNVADKDYVLSSDVYGKVIFNIPKLGYFQNFLSNAYGWILLILFPCVAIIIYDVIKLYELFRKNINIRKDKSLVCMIKKNNEIMYYYDLKSAIIFANQEMSDTTIIMLVNDYDLVKDIVIETDYTITLTTESSIFTCNIYNNTNGLLINKGNLVLKRVFIKKK